MLRLAKWTPIDEYANTPSPSKSACLLLYRWPQGNISCVSSYTPSGSPKCKPRWWNSAHFSFHRAKLPSVKRGYTRSSDHPTKKNLRMQTADHYYIVPSLTWFHASNIDNEKTTQENKETRNFKLLPYITDPLNKIKFLPLKNKQNFSITIFLSFFLSFCVIYWRTKQWVSFLN